ncbi:hypothetical protein [Nocardioides sp.]|uniref:hypothetical protein n=1 Tax=Nocardioides sp. TaxID=35761 RepID=UPI0035138CFA
MEHEQGTGTDRSIATALHRLAESARPAPGPPGGDLWRAGVRRARRRRAAWGAVGAAVVLGATAVLVPQAAPDVDPAGDGAPPAVPRLVWPGTTAMSSAGPDDPPGILAVVAGYGYDLDDTVMVVSAETGEYRDLELPGRVGLPRLAPDGRHLAFWVLGSPAGTPYPEDGREQPPVGVDVMDAVTGEIQRYRPPTEHGITTDQLRWGDDDTLLLTWGQRRSPVLATGLRTVRWDIEGEPDPAQDVQAAVFVAEPRNLDGTLYLRRSPRILVRSDEVPAGGGPARLRLDVPAPEDVRTVAVAGPHVIGTVADGTGVLQLMVGRWRAEATTSAAPRSGQTGETGGTGVVDGWRRVEGGESATMLGFLDADTALMVRSNLRSGAADPEPDLTGVATEALDLTDLTWRTVGEVSTTDLDLATDLLTRPLMEGVRPPQPGRGPLPWILGGGIAVAVALGWRSARRRGRGLP